MWVDWKRFMGISEVKLLQPANGIELNNDKITDICRTDNSTTRMYFN